MSKKIPDYLKLHREDPMIATPVAPRSSELSSVDMLCCAFERTTGWHLRYEPPATEFARGGGSATANGAGLVLSPAQRRDDERFPRLPRQEVEHLAAAIAIVLGELEMTRRAVAEREAELAAGVPVAARPNEEAHLADRLEATLASGAGSVGAHAAALYLLDEGTSQLKLRACFNLPGTRLLDEARPLRGAIADLEALLGHAVVIEDTSLLPHWRCPEDYPSAVCIPVSTPNTPLGTLWVFSETPRDFTPSQTNVLETVAGRIAADLEREVLLTAGAESKVLARQLHEASRWQEEHLPTIAPLIDDWEIAGAVQAGGALASEFFDWTILNDGALAVALGDAHGRAMTAGMSVAALQTAVKAHAAHRHTARQMLERVNDTLWTSSPGGQYGSLGYGLILPESGELEFAAAGRVGALLVHREGHLLVASHQPPLGSDPDLQVLARKLAVPPGSALVLFSDGVPATRNADQRPWDEAAIAEFLQRQLQLSARELVARLQSAFGPVGELDRTLLIVKRLR